MKNHAVVNLVFRKSVLFLFASIFLLSCKKEDDDPTPPAQSQNISFEVRLVKMVSLDIKESEDDHLEVYGTINADLIRGNVTEANELWSAGSAEYISVGLSDFPMNNAVTFTVSPENLSDSMIEMTSSLMEHDFSASNPDENLGTETISAPLSAVSSTSTFQVIHDASSGQEVQVTFSITRL